MDRLNESIVYQAKVYRNRLDREERLKTLNTLEKNSSRPVLQSYN